VSHDFELAETSIVKSRLSVPHGVNQFFHYIAPRVIYSVVFHKVVWRRKLDEVDNMTVSHSVHNLSLLTVLNSVKITVCNHTMNNTR